jgi:hypothetical protein
MEAERKTASNIEFLEFLADISSPATGEISISGLANLLCQTEAEFKKKWRKRGACIPIAIFVDETLAVLDAAQDQICDLNSVVEWYLNKPIANYGMKTPQHIVASGLARRLVVAIQANEISFSLRMD